MGDDIHVRAHDVGVPQRFLQPLDGRALVDAALARHGRRIQRVPLQAQARARQRAHARHAGQRRRQVQAFQHLALVGVP